VKQYYYNGDPYWLTARFAGTCSGCGKPLAKGEQVFRFKNGKLFAESCGCGIYESQQFEQIAQDEYLGGY